MSNNSSRQTYQAFSEWYTWAKTKYPILKQKKKKTPPPVWAVFKENDY
jgi:hypothetical protein